MSKWVGNRQLLAAAPTMDWVAVPWHVAAGPAEVRHRDGWLVCTVPSDEYARLIAAAPSLLSALKEAEAHINRASGGGETGIRAKLNAAIAKAEGAS